MEDPDKKEQLKHDIVFISNDISERIHEEREHFKTGCERVKKLNVFAYKQTRDHHRRQHEVKSKVGKNSEKADNSANWKMVTIASEQAPAIMNEQCCIAKTRTCEMSH